MGRLEIKSVINGSDPLLMILNLTQLLTLSFAYLHIHKYNFSWWCQQIAYEYAKKRANLVLVARREHRLHGISDNAKRLGAPNVLVMAADVVKEEDCRRFINETIGYFGRGNPYKLLSDFEYDANIDF